MLWIVDHFFQNEKAEGWFDAILIQVRSHPQANRTMEFADHCEELWGRELPTGPYPPFEKVAQGSRRFSLTWTDGDA